MTARSRRSTPRRPPPRRAKGYWIGHVDVDDPEGYKLYMVANQAPFGEFGARLFWCAAAPAKVPEGAARARNRGAGVPSFEAALAC